MNKLTNTQMQILVSYLLILFIFIIIGLLISKHERGLGFLVGLNVGISIIGVFWLWKGQKAWNDLSQLKNRVKK